MDKENNNQLQVEIKPEVASGIYSNFAIVANATSEFVIDFAAFLPGATKAEVRSRIIMTPEHAKRLMMALQKRISDYESQFGKIDLHQPDMGRTIAPFGTGEA